MSRFFLVCMWCTPLPRTLEQANPGMATDPGLFFNVCGLQTQVSARVLTSLVHRLTRYSCAVLNQFTFVSVCSWCTPLPRPLEQADTRNAAGAWRPISRWLMLCYLYSDYFRPSALASSSVRGARLCLDPSSKQTHDGLLVSGDRFFDS